MKQIDKAKEAVNDMRETWTEQNTFMSIAESMFSIAVSLDKVREECRNQTKEMIKLMKAAQEVQKKLLK